MEQYKSNSRFIPRPHTPHERVGGVWPRDEASPTGGGRLHRAYSQPWPVWSVRVPAAVSASQAPSTLGRRLGDQVHPRRAVVIM